MLMNRSWSRTHLITKILVLLSIIGVVYANCIGHPSFPPSKGGAMISINYLQYGWPQYYYYNANKYVNLENAIHDIVVWCIIILTVALLSESIIRQFEKVTVEPLPLNKESSWLKIHKTTKLLVLVAFAAILFANCIGSPFFPPDNNGSDLYRYEFLKYGWPLSYCKNFTIEYDWGNARHDAYVCLLILLTVALLSEFMVRIIAKYSAVPPLGTKEGKDEEKKE